jgi:iron(III) transport system ATP-binding protein
MVFQDWALFPHLDVARNVGFGLPRAERRESPRIDAALAMVGLDGLGHRMPDTLSGGQQQRVALARALAPEPSVLLLDEPFSNLDASLRHQIRTDVHRLLVSLGVTTVFVTHDQGEAFVLGDQVVVLHGGWVAQAGPPDQVYRRPADRWVAEFVGHANFVPGTATGTAATTTLGPVELLDPCEGPVEVLVRPEHLRLALDGAGGPGHGTVELVEFVGHSTSYLVRLGEVTVRVRDAALPRFERGDAVDLALDPVPTVAFPV